MPLLKRRGLFEASRIVYLPLSEIQPNPDQPRKNFEPAALSELAGSISRYGVLQPLTVRRRCAGYELVSGERRLRAAKLAGLKNVPCIILDVDAQKSSILALVENLQRKDLDFIEEAEGLYHLVNTYQHTQEEVARLVGLSQSAVSNKLRLLKLSPALLTMLRESGLTERHARALLRLETEEARLEVIKEILTRNLNVANTEEFIDGCLQKKEEQEKQPVKPVYVLKDVRLFLNTLSRGMNLMQQSGIDAQYGRDETDNEIVLTIKIPKTK
ncbi:ParB/RepB/Spo0J family partition protein [Oscillospiraceae bacterium CM]|nr:ParB/RepB/Spo0J family partition protein [Oscillospiraceae bacterium CM]